MMELTLAVGRLLQTRIFESEICLVYKKPIYPKHVAANECLWYTLFSLLQSIAMDAGSSAAMESCNWA
ncbi:hypothetical protein MRB53_030263 [Persea americana]|uniref:Uncharacterized protein n=1 Tax=Persea americana TaxID=3435 RepID=A0ACC2KL89_PERAE|nr:hypothetical protein MRB53_030263 [Persea americana]